tara:strand:- start:20 stop:688 length:669 start_codon:yes stop_codon:yes gene_type:complete
MSGDLREVLLTIFEAEDSVEDPGGPGGRLYRGIMSPRNILDREEYFRGLESTVRHQRGFTMLLRMLQFLKNNVPEGEAKSWERAVTAAAEAKQANVSVCRSMKMLTEHLEANPDTPRLPELAAKLEAFKAEAAAAAEAEAVTAAIAAEAAAAAGPLIETALVHPHDRNTEEWEQARRLESVMEQDVSRLVKETKTLAQQLGGAFTEEEYEKFVFIAFSPQPW